MNVCERVCVNAFILTVDAFVLSRDLTFVLVRLSLTVFCVVGEVPLEWR
jgi:hypothetical protein